MPDCVDNKSDALDVVTGEAPQWQPAYSPTVTFSRLPFVEKLIEGEADIAVMGIPWDGLVTCRPGARFGPLEIRQASANCRNYSQHMQLSVYEHSRVVDVGDIDTSENNTKEIFGRIESRTYELYKMGVSVVSLGGDHSILVPLLRALRRNQKEFMLIQIDAHTDTSECSNTQQYHHGTCIRNVIDEGLIAGSNIFQIGIRGSFGSADYLEYGRKQGINVMDMHDFHNPGYRCNFLDRLRETAGTKPCYITFDIDGVDPAFAPGTGTPVPGGLSSYEAINLLRDLRGLNCIGGDVVEVAPVYDNQSQITSLLGAGIAQQIISLIALSRGNNIYR